MSIKRFKAEIVIKHRNFAIAGFSKDEFETLGLDHLFREVSTGSQEFELYTDKAKYGTIPRAGERTFLAAQYLRGILISHHEYLCVKRQRPMTPVEGETIVFHLTTEEFKPKVSSLTNTVQANTRASMYLDGELDTPATPDDVARVIGDVTFLATGVH